MVERTRNSTANGKWRNSTRVGASLVLLFITACTSAPSSLSPKKVAMLDPIEPSAVAGTTQPHFEYQNRCGKPCQPLTLHWLLDGSYQLIRGDEPAMAGRMSDAQVTQLSALYQRLRELTRDLPSDLSRATICTSFATDHAVKIFATPATTESWQFKDNLGCSGFEIAERLRELEANIEALLPTGTNKAPSQRSRY
ncbi:hypothetical protein HPT27_05455 [Permianibacter sp. IMCC34836]|uniref:hypothetical protein n=1 Tax=Permianibacter fluminis TaxID=2738515 RepID=UPI001552E01B|nr:hypothetical protein [Permianibacter fluminis]NQD36465.1 hypothetical protein [Permianibacter fluminis]